MDNTIRGFAFNRTRSDRLLVEIELVEHIAKSLSLVNGNGNALAHLLVVGRPGTNIVHRLSVIPADEIELFVPTVVTLAYNADFVNYFILDFRHFLSLLIIITYILYLKYFMLTLILAHINSNVNKFVKIANCFCSQFVLKLNYGNKI